MNRKVSAREESQENIINNKIFQTMNLIETVSSSWGVIFTTGLFVANVAFIWLMSYYLRIYKSWKKNYLVESSAYRLTTYENVKNLPPVYPNGWYMLLMPEELPEGILQHVSALGEKFAVYRNSAKKASVVQACCSQLKFASGNLNCSVHNVAGSDGETPSNFKVFVCKEECDSILVWYHADNDEPTWLPPNYPDITSDKYCKGAEAEFIIRGHCQDITENASDNAHFAVVHEASSLSGSDPGFADSIWTKVLKHIWWTTWEPSPDETEKHVALLSASHYLQIFNKVVKIPITANSKQYGPGFVVSILDNFFGRFYIVETLIPVGPMTQKLIQRTFCQKSTMAKLMALVSHAALVIMLERDIIIWNHKRFVDKPMLVKEEKNIAKFRRWYSQFYSENSQLFSF